ncbi:hypothetical protein ACLKA6_000585 [Drosophila palustris]
MTYQSTSKRGSPFVF